MSITLKYTFLSTDTSFFLTLPVTSYVYLVNWDDGSTPDNSLTHTYTFTTNRTFTITITATATNTLFPIFSHYGAAAPSAPYLISCNFTDCTVDNLSNAFYNCTSLLTVGKPTGPSTTNMQFMFYGATSFDQDISGWNTSNVESMRSMFQGATLFNQPIGDWTTDNVEDMSSMFQDATSFDQDISDWTTNKVEIMQGMFFGATSFNQNVGGWDFSNVTNMNNMFHNNGLTIHTYDLFLYSLNNNTNLPIAPIIGVTNLIYSQIGSVYRSNLIGIQFDGDSPALTLLGFSNRCIEFPINDVTWNPFTEDTVYIMDITAIPTDADLYDTGTSPLNIHNILNIQKLHSYIIVNSTISTHSFYFISNITHIQEGALLTVTWIGGTETVSLINSNHVLIHYTNAVSASTTFDLTDVLSGIYYLRFNDGHYQSNSNPFTINTLNIHLTSYIVSTQTSVIWNDDNNYNVSIIRERDGAVMYLGSQYSGFQFLLEDPIITNGVDYFYINLLDVISGANYKSTSFQFIIYPWSNICFAKGTLIQTDQGLLPIETCTNHSIRKHKFNLTETISFDTHLVRIEKNAFGKTPTHSTILSGEHKLLYENKMQCAKDLVNNDTVTFIPYDGQPLYNVLLPTHSTVNVYGLVCETLNPNSNIAKIFKDIPIKHNVKYEHRRRQTAPMSILDFFKN
jgi:surface protein